MLNIESIFLFLFIFSILNIINFTFNLIRAFSQENPQPLKIGKMSLIFLGISVSYILTYILQTT